jgi:hypothetical protein
MAAMLIAVSAESLRAGDGHERPPIRDPFKPDRYRTNWIEQQGGGTWSGVYMKNGWLEESSSGDPNLEVECDIELHCSQTISNNKIYFHIGNIYTALQNPQTDLTATFDGTFSSNNGMYVGICFEGTGKGPADMLQDTGGYTGEIKDAMVGTADVLGRDITGEAFNAKILLSEDGGSTWNRPFDYGTDASGTIVETLWWLIAGGGEGTYDVKWKVEILPEAHQADGNYRFDPAIVVAPIL